jgi:hypothetical protein
MDRKIKKFGQFMSDRKFRSSLSRLVVTGKTKKFFFSKSIDFELHILHTPEKHRIIDIVAYGIELDNPKLNLTFKIGDNADIAKKWIDDNGYLLLYEINK